MVDDESFTYEVRKTVWNIAGDLTVEMGIPVSAMVYRYSDFKKGVTPFLKEVKSYGRIFE